MCKLVDGFDANGGSVKDLVGVRVHGRATFDQGSGCIGDFSADDLVQLANISAHAFRHMFGTRSSHAE